MPNFILKSFLLLFCFLLFMLRFEYRLSSDISEILPAIELCLIYYLSTYKKLCYWHLFIIGLLIDMLYDLPLITTSSTLMTANFILKKLTTKILAKNFLTNILIFYLYSFFVISIRFVIIRAFSLNNIDIYSLYFYFFTTIFSYPIIFICMEKLIKIFANHDQQ